MSPTNLAALPSNQPVPTGLCQTKLGSYSAAGITLNNTFSPRPLEDGLGGPMRISITPARAGMWVIHAETIWTMNDPVWMYWHWGVRCVPLDADGKGDDRNHCAQHSALSWNEHVINTAYRLNAGTPYYAEMYWPNSSSGYNQQYYAHGYYHYILGEFIEDGAL